MKKCDDEHEHDDDEEVRCAGCGNTKKRADFNINRTTYNGLQSWCRDCQKRQNRIRHSMDAKKRIAEAEAEAESEAKLEADILSEVEAKASETIKNTDWNLLAERVIATVKRREQNHIKARNKMAEFGYEMTLQEYKDKLSKTLGLMRAKLRILGLDPPHDDWLFREYLEKLGVPLGLPEEKKEE